MPAWSRILRAMFVAYLAATAVHLAFIIMHEPFAFDAWNVAADTRAQPFTLGRFAAYVADQYTHSNPRIGQPLTYLAYKLTWFAPIVTPLAWLAFTLGIFVLGTGRWPSIRRGRDLALWTIVVGFAWFALPDIGKILFCRAYCANYVYGATLQLWFLVVLRLTGGDRAPRGALIAYACAGVVAGMCNEHTGPTLILFMLGYCWWRQRTTGARPLIAWAGTLGIVVGFAAIFFAPGQGERYQGLATKVTLLDRLLQRGITANLDIYRDFVIGTAPLLALLAIVIVVGAVRDRELTPDAFAARRRALVIVGLVALAGSLTTMTLFVSPKLGTRFFLHACALLLAAFIGVADTILTSRRRLVPFVVLALFASGYAIARTVPLYARLARDSDARIAAIEATPRATFFTASSFEQVDDSWWFLGDDFRDIHKREMITNYFDLAGVVLRAVDITVPLGVSDVRLRPRYTVTPASCLENIGGLELETGSFRALDVASIEESSRSAIDVLRARLPAGTRLDQLDVVVDFVGATPPLPRPTLIVARWWPDHWEAHVGGIERKGKSTKRTLIVPRELRGQPYDMYIYQVGGEARKLGGTSGDDLTYVPWKSGAYWELACGVDSCFVLFATRQTS